MTREDIIKDVASKFATHSINTGVTDCYGQLIIERGLNNDEERGFGLVRNGQISIQKKD